MSSNAASTVLGSPPAVTMQPKRVRWVDCARGWCIVLVVMMHSALGVGVLIGDGGWLHAIVAFAKPFRMPDFFLVAGLFVARTLDVPWRRFLDRKVVHFAYFYMLWLLIALLIKAHALSLTDPRSFASEYVWRLVQPFSTTWFIQLLPILYVVTRVARRIPTLGLIAFALVLHFIAAIKVKGGVYTMESNLTGSITVDGFLLFWIYFVFGVRLRTMVFRLAETAAARPALAIGFLLTWGAFEAIASARFWPEIYGFDLFFGVLGAIAVIVMSALVATLRSMAWLAYVGQRSLFIYLAFFIPMAATRAIVLRLAPQLDGGTASLLVTVAAIAGPLLAERILRSTPLRFLFARPNWARLKDAEADGRRGPSGTSGVVQRSAPRIEAA